MTPRLIYVADPMCSWCWGFAPEVESLRTRFDLPVEVIVGGLRPGPAAQPLDAAMSQYLRSTWRRISELTGQPFDDTPLGWEGWTYDTELPARAVVSVRSMSPNDALAFFARVQRAFYAEAIDVTEAAAYDPLIAPLGLDQDDFKARLVSEASREAAWDDFRRTREMGIGGFPALFVDADDGPTAITLGYRPATALVPLIERALQGV